MTVGHVQHRASCHQIHGDAVAADDACKDGGGQDAVAPDDGDDNDDSECADQKASTVFRTCPRLRRSVTSVLSQGHAPDEATPTASNDSPEGSVGQRVAPRAFCEVEDPENPIYFF